MRILMLPGVLFLSGCMSFTYHPAEYVLDDGRIDDFNVSGSVDVENGSIADESMVIFDGVVTWSTSRKEINSALTAQLQEEVNRHGVVRGTKSKPLQVTVNNYHAEQPGFVFKVSNDFTVSGDGGFKKDFKITDTTNGNIGGDIIRSFNSAIAVSVIHVLKDPDVLAYLAR